MNAAHSLRRSLLAALLRVALVGALVAAAYGVYRRLPHDEDAGAHHFARASSPASALRIRLRDTEDFRRDASAARVPVHLYPINMAAARNEYESDPRQSGRFEEFATRLMGDRQPLTAELDERGEAVVAVPPGRWWVHVTLEGAREFTWRLPVNVNGRQKTVELTPDNAYTRAKRF